MFLQLSARAFHFFVLSTALLVGLAATARPYPAPAIPAAEPPARPERRLWLKAGLRLSHLTYAFGPRGRVFVLPVSVGAGYRLTSQFSLYGQAEADVTGRGGRRRRGGVVPTAGNDIALGLRYYYRHPGTLNSLRARPFARDYLALEGNADFAESTGSRRGRGIALNFTPALYAFWGTQHRWSSFPLLFDFSAGLGLQVLPRYGPDRAAVSRLDVAAQVNLRMYFRR